MVRKLSIKVLSKVHIFLYLGTRGRIGNRMAGMPILLLSTTGRRSGQRRTVPLGYLMAGMYYVLIGSNGGQDKHPAWILNLRANPKATVLIGRNRIPVVAAEADPARRSRLWEELIRQAPIYEGYRKRTAREIPVIILEPRTPASDSQGPSIQGQPTQADQDHSAI